jgi:trk system potassium uptake protein TrkH
MALEDLRIQYKDLGGRILGTVKLILAFTCALALFWEFGSTPYGQRISESEKSIIRILDYAIIIVFLAKNCLVPLLLRQGGGYVKRNFIEIMLSVLLVLFLLTSGDSFYEYPLIAVKVFALLTYPYRVFVGWLARVRVNTPLTVAFSFLTIIIVGTLLFMLPKSTVPGRIDAVDALFTSTSATCVTGLVVVDTGTYYSPFGQAVLLCLIQVGGLGLMTFMAFFGLTLGRGLGLRQEVVMKDALSLEHRFGLRRVIVFILSMTFVLELIGAVAIYVTFPFPTAYSVGERIWFSIFHSISAFCNSGFSLLSTSFMTARSHVSLNIVAAALIVIGGLGFVVNYNIFSYFARLFRRKRSTVVLQKEAGLARLRYFGIQTKVVIITTVILLAAGTFLIYALEAPRSFGCMPGSGPEGQMTQGEKWTASFFQSMTARTAGFNTVDIGSLLRPTLLILIILMFIGASPGSTGGGIKTSTFAIFILSVISRLRNRSNVEVFKRRVPQRVIFNCVAVVILALCLVVASTIVLTIVEPDGRFLPMLFEVVSAFGTVGLSAGITASLSVAGKITIIVTMFIGRIGPLTLMLAMSGQSVPKRYEYPEERVMIG